MPPQSANILVVGDDPTARNQIRKHLAKGRFAIHDACDATEAFAMLSEQRFDLVLLGVEMCGFSAAEVCQRIRKFSSELGIVMVILGHSESETVRALEAGADDCVSKPIRYRELGARVRAVLRRLQLHDVANNRLLQPGDLLIDLNHRIVQRGGRHVHLTPTEFNLLILLMENKGSALPHARILQQLWGAEHMKERGYLRTFVRSLRKKIEVDPTAPRHLLTEPCVGYRWCEPGLDTGSER